MVRIKDFIANTGNFAAPNLYLVTIAIPPALKAQIPNATEAERKLTFTVKAASIPASTIGVRNAPFLGRIYPVDGDRTFEPWNVTVMNTKDWNVRSVLEKWSDWIDGNVNHDQINNGDQPLDYMAEAKVFHMGKNEDDIIATYTFVGLWPQTIGEIPLGWDSNDTIEEFPVTFQYAWWESENTRNSTTTSNQPGESII